MTAVPPRGSRAWWAGHLPVPTSRAAGLVAVAAVLVGFVPWPAVRLSTPATTVTVLAVAMVLVGVDAALAPAPWSVGVTRELPAVLALGSTGTLRWSLTNPAGRRVVVALADELAPSLGADRRRARVVLAARGRAHAAATLRPTRRGTFRPTLVTVRVAGPLGLATRQASRAVPGHLEVHPSFRSRDATELRLRRSRVLLEGVRAFRGRAGGTEFESLRDHVEGDEFRHIDWAATARAGRPIVRTYRPERNQTVVVLLDTGRVVAGLVEGVPRLDHGMDATLALATAATRLGDRIGLVAFGAGTRAVVAPRRDRGQLRRISSAMHALEPELAESGYHDAFRTTLARFRRRALIVLVTELAAEAVQETLVPALPLVTREHAVVVASVRDPAVDRLRDDPGPAPDDAFAAAAAAAVLHDRERAAARVRTGGAEVVDAVPGRLAGALVDRYLDVKAAGRL